MNTTQDDGGPAFPAKRMEDIGLLDQEPNFAELEYTGLSIRDWFAGMALQGTAANPAFHREKWESHAEACYKAANAMIAARKEAR